MSRQWRFIALVSLLVGGAAWQVAPAALGLQQPGRLEQSGGDVIVSPSVLASYATWRDASGSVNVDILILWRGSPGWMLRRTGSASSSGGGTPDRAGIVRFSSYQGGLHLTATYDRTSRNLDVLGDRVDLKGANVVLVDRVDSPDGPVILKTTIAPAIQSQTLDVSRVLRHTPELLDYLRCDAQVPGGLNHPSMQAVCADAVLTGAVKTPATINAVPTGPVTNRAAGTAPPPPDRTMRPGAVSSGNSVLSASVAGGWFTHVEADGAQSLDLLVLWRGSLGWPLKNSSGGSGGGSGNARRGMTVRYGERSLYAAYEIGPRRYQIEDDIKPLGDDNVVLVDDVDAPSGLRVLKTLRVDPAIPGGNRIDQLIARSPELRTYLRCDVKLPDARQQAMVEILCARYARADHEEP
jgi:hypothetical protein